MPRCPARIRENLASSNPKILATSFQEFLQGVHNAVGLGDMKQGVEQFFENRRPVGEHFCDLFGVAVEPAGILARHSNTRPTFFSSSSGTSRIWRNA